MKNKIPDLTTSNTMLATVVTFLILATIITMGMLTPLIAKLVNGVEISLDPGYYNTRSALPVAALVLLLSTCMLIGYADKKYIVPIVTGSVVLSIIFAVLAPFGNTPIDISLPILIVALLTAFYRIYRIVLGKQNASTKNKIRSISAHVIHVGILLILLGIILSSNMKIESSAVLSSGSGEIVSFDGQHYQLIMNSMNSYYSGEAFRNYPASSYTTEVIFDIYKNGRYFKSGKVNYITDFKWGQSYTTTYINHGLTEELFIAPRAIDESAGEIDLYMRTVPFINCLWGGIYLMVIGIIALILTDRGNKDRAIDPTSVVSEKSSANGTDNENKYDRMLQQEIQKRKANRVKGKR
ncbi:cytochrome c-type biogenesis CcmF C-terminal domain-containing protein [Methanolobus sediminis]|uniref:Cytochrome c-type biogenesis CcmF C-terminal domain-containing protein n=1 Tax=Methanolobus sediminis TaxID=3072978 RepID=A0AA51YJR0_9EURY|nr:cytochrome c-type biogenesis CcmF C-terminal domain-containing protein [Methanolobus sediminis]WMW25780.1 cytochrome c-type biogenesis CcmF C-terminal domain-containing protein [Methanolobus sediminis]